jgi:hypothetical protein
MKRADLERLLYQVLIARTLDDCHRAYLVPPEAFELDGEDWFAGEDPYEIQKKLARSI